MEQSQQKQQRQADRVKILNSEPRNLQFLKSRAYMGDAIILDGAKIRYYDILDLIEKYGEGIGVTIQDIIQTGATNTIKATVKDVTIVNIARIAPGQVLTARSIGDADCIYSLEVISRTEKQAKVKIRGNEVTCKIYSDGETEYVKALGQHSFSPTFRATTAGNPLNSTL